MRALRHDDPDRYALMVLNQALGGGMSSRLFQEVRERRGLAYSVYSYRAALADAGVLAVSAGTAPDRVDELLDVLDRELRRVVDDAGITDRELAAAHGHLRGSLALSLESSGARMHRLGRNEVTLGDVPSPRRGRGAHRRRDARRRRPGRRAGARRRPAHPRRRRPVHRPAVRRPGVAFAAVTKVGVFGAGGRMGRTVCGAVAAEPGLELVAAVDPYHAGIDLQQLGVADTGLQVAGSADALTDAGADVAVDFTVLDAARGNLAWCAEHGIHAVVGTTGFTPDEFDRLRARFDTSHANAVIAPNFSIGAVLMMRFAELAAPLFDTAEIIELHHDDKIDAPSGTSLLTAERMARRVARLGRRPDPADGRRGRPRRRRVRASGSTRCACAGSSPTRRCCSARPARR